MDIPKIEAENIEIKAYRFNCAKEQTRTPRVIRVGLFQNKLPLPTWTPIQEQRQALYNLAEKTIDMAATAKINVICFQEAWSK